MNVTAFPSSVNLSGESVTESGCHLGLGTKGLVLLTHYIIPLDLLLSLSVSLCCHLFMGKMYDLSDLSTISSA